MSANDVSNAQLWERLGAVISTVELLRADFIRADNSATLYREKIYLRLDQTVERLTKAEGEIEDLKEDHAATARKVEELTTLRARAAGGMAVITVLAGAVGAIAAAFADQIFQAIKRFFGG